MFYQDFLNKNFEGKQIKTWFTSIYIFFKVLYEQQIIYFWLLSCEKKTRPDSGSWSPFRLPEGYIIVPTRYYQSVITFQQRLLQSASYKSPFTLVNISEMVSSITKETSKRVQMDQCASIHTKGETSKYPPLRGRQLCHPFLIERPAEFYSPERKKAAIEC